MSAAPTPPESTSAPDATKEPLTLGRLAYERLLRANAAALTGPVGEQRVTWCVPWEQAFATNDPLTDVLVYATAEQVGNDSALQILARRRAAGVVAAGAAEARTDTPIPVLAVDSWVSFRDVNHLVAELELARETHVLRYGLTVHSSLVELLYRGAGLAALCHQMTRLSGCTTAVLDPHYRVLAFEQSRDRVLEPVAVAAALRAVELPTPEHDDVTATPRVCPLEIGDLRATGIVNAILLAGRHDGWVVVIEPTDDPHPHDMAQHRVVVDQSATIVGTELLRMRSVEQAEERARGDFVHALLHGRFATRHDLEARAAHYDFPVDATYGVVVAGMLSSGDGTESLTALFQLARDIARLSLEPGMRTLVTVVGNALAVIRQVGHQPRSNAPDAANQALASYAHTLDEELVRRVHRPVAVAYGRPVVGADRIFDSYREARVALGLRRRLGSTSACGFQELRVYAMLFELAGSPAAATFTDDILTPLRDSRAAGSDLEQAVVAYIQNGGNLNAAARQLHIHRNTMLYKLERASRLLHLDLRDAEQQFTVWLAHKLSLLAEATGEVDRDLRPV